MNPILRIGNLPLLGNTLAIFFFVFLVQSATAHNFRHNATVTSKYYRNSAVKLHYDNNTASSQSIHQNQSFLNDIEVVMNTINNFKEGLHTSINAHHRPKRRIDFPNYRDEEYPDYESEEYISVPDVLEHPNSRGRGDHNLAHQLDNLETKISNMNSKLRLLDNTDSLGGDFKTRKNELETIARNLQTSVDNIRQNMTGEVINVNQTMDNLTQSANNLYPRIENLEQEIREEAARRLPSEIVKDVKSRMFHDAKVKLDGKDDDMYYYVVHEVYNHRASNFDLLLDFGDYITITEYKFKIYDFLFKETVINGLNDPRKILRLRQSIQNNVIDASVGALAAINLHNLLQKLMEEAAVEPIYSAFLFDNSWVTVNQLSTDIGNDCHKCTNRIFNLVIKTIWNKITIDDLLYRSHKNLNLRENIAVHLAVMNILKRTGGLRNTSVITFARFMKLIMEDSRYKSESFDRRSQYEEAKNKIPEPVKNLVFSSAICIKDKAHSEYLYAEAAPDYVYDNNRRHVYTWIPGNSDEPPKFKWYVSFLNSHEIMLRNAKYNEYLYADGFSYDDTRRYVFTWRPGSTVTNGIWRVKIDGNYIRMFNTEHGGYLFADHNEIKNETRRHVFTSQKGGKKLDSKWEIIDFSNF